MKGAEFHRNNFAGNHVVEGGECYLVRGVSSCYLLKNMLHTLCESAADPSGALNHYNVHRQSIEGRTTNDCQNREH